MSDTVVYSGPAFDGTVERLINEFIVNANQQIAETVETAVKTRLHSVLVNPTGNYESHIQVERQQDDRAVNDSNIVYGPWLEGVSSRNQTTRFKGYTTFRMVYTEQASNATNLVTSIFESYVRKMN